MMQKLLAVFPLRKLILILLAGVFCFGGMTASAAERPPSGPIPQSNPGYTPKPVDEEGLGLPPPDPRGLPVVEPSPTDPTFLWPSTSVVINEFDEIYDQIEFYNLGTTAVNMAGWQLKIYDYTDTLSNVYIFPTGFSLAPGAYVVVHEGGNPTNNTSTDLYSAADFLILAQGGAMALTNNSNWGKDFVRWGMSLVSPPQGTGWAGANPYLPDFVFFSLGRNSSSDDRDYGEDWTLQNSSYGAQNLETLCVELLTITTGAGAAPLVSPANSAGCDPGYYVPGEVLTLTANPSLGWEVGQWDEKPATEYLGTEEILEYTMTVAHEYVWLGYIQSDPPPGSALLLGLWSNYAEALDALGIPYDQLNGYTFAPDWEVLDRYDLVIIQTIGGAFIPNLRTTSFSTYLDEGGCMWVEADEYQPPETGEPDVLFAYFGVNTHGAAVVPGNLIGTGGLYTGLGPYPDLSGGAYPVLTATNGAESAFEGDLADVFGLTKLTPDYLSAYITFDFNSLLPAAREEILGKITETCIPGNDDFDDAFEITSLAYTNTQHYMAIRHATIAADDPVLLPFGTPQRDYSVWYRYTPSSTIGLQVDTFDSDYDTILGVWTGSRGSLTKVAYNDDSGGSQSKLNFVAEAGTTYFIEVASFDMFEFGTLVLNVDGPVTLPCYTLLLSSSAGGTDPVPTPANSDGCAPGKFVQGQVVDLTAAPDPGYEVSSWSGTDDDESTSTTNSFTMPGNNYAVSVSYAGASTFLFESDFEEGDLLEWTRFNDGGGWLYVCGEGAINGIWGACIERGDNDRRKQLIDETPVNQTVFNARLNFDINSLSMAEGERFRFLQTKMGTERPFFIVLKYDTGQYQFQFSVRLDDGTYTKTGWYVLGDAPHTIEVDWAASTGPGNDDGEASLYLDDVLLETLSGLDNDSFFVENFKVGFTSRLEGKVISGIFYVDDVATSNTGHIGLP